MIFQLIPPLAIPGVAFMYSSKYTHSPYWFWSTGKPWASLIFLFTEQGDFYLVVAAFDMRNCYILFQAMIE